MTTTEIPARPNGVNVEAVLGAREHMTADPSLADFTWRARNTWVSGTHSRTVIDEFHGAGGEHRHTAPVTHESDHPALFGAEDNGVTPLEFVLHALAACLTGGLASVAANRGVTLNAAASTIEGDMDLRGILGIDRRVRNGFGVVRVRFEVDADADPETIEALVAQSQLRSAVYDVLTGNVPVEIDIVAAPIAA